VLYYADQISVFAAQIDPLRARTEELERQKREWFEPEFNRLQEAIEDYEKTKREWFEPQLHQQWARVIELETRLSGLAQFEGSRSYRAWMKFQTLYRIPVIGLVLRLVRRAMRFALHATHRS
jgi:hypothetical protein